MEYGIYAGVDVSKESFTVCIRKPNGKIVFQGSFPNLLKAFRTSLTLSITFLLTLPLL